MDARYWNEALETCPWVEVSRWQAGQVAQALPAMRERSGLYRELHAGLPTPLHWDDLGALAELPFTLKEHVRAAQAAATDEQPLGSNQCVPMADIVQLLCSSGTTGRPLY